MSQARAQTGRGLAGRVLASYPDFRAAMARQLEDPPREARLLVWAVAAGLVGFLAGLPNVTRQAAALDAPDALTAVLTGRLFAALFLFPLMLYLLATLSRLVARLFGGRGSLATARLALFWSVIAALPVLVLSAAASALLRAWDAAAAAPLAGLVSALSAAAFAWIWAASLAEAEGFRRTVPVFAFLLAFPAILATLPLIFLP